MLTAFHKPVNSGCMNISKLPINYLNSEWAINACALIILYSRLMWACPFIDVFAQQIALPINHSYIIDGASGLA